MTQFITKLAGSFAVLALVATVLPGQALGAPAVVHENFNTHSGEDWAGIALGFKVSDLGTVTALSVELSREDGSTITKHANNGVFGITNQPGEHKLSTPFFISEGTNTEAGDSLYWQPIGDVEWNTSTKPTSYTVTVTTEESETPLVFGPFTGFNEGEPSWPTYVSMVPAVNAENFNTHSDAAYKGINVGFNVANISEFNEVTVALKDAGGKTIATNDGNLEMLNTLLEGGTLKYSTPFITYNGTYGPEAYWTLGDWESYALPHTAVITVNGIEVQETTLDSQHDWATLIPQIIPENFNTHAGVDYEGINVGFDVANFNEFESVTVELQDADGNTLAVNEGVVSKLNTLLNGGVGEFSTPFITKNLTYGEEAFWTLGEWQSAALPAKAIITINGIVVAENETLSIQHDWTTIAPVIEEEEEEVEEPRRRSGGSRRVVDSTPAGEVLGVQTGPDTQGQVLGASTYVFTRDLTIGSRGDDVVALQAMLIASGDLAIAAPTGYFGELTRAALAKWQAAHGVAPAAGYFGPITRAAILAAGTPVMTAEARAALIAELLEKVLELQKQLADLEAGA